MASERAGVAAEIRLRRPGRSDGAAVYELIRACPPLDVNSAYAYFLICDHFRETSVVAETDRGLVGCLTGYRRPDDPEVLFIWQIAVHGDARGAGLGRRMLDAVVAAPTAGGARWLETTISPGNAASRRLFARWADTHGFGIEETEYLASRQFPDSGGAAHESEHLFRIGPLDGPDRSHHEGGSATS